MSGTERFDVLVLGGGAAGLTLALSLPETLSIAVLTKSDWTESSTYHAQGGIAAVIDAADSFNDHVADTLEAGAGLCNPGAVEYTVANGPEAIRRLIALGVDFSRDDAAKGAAGYHLTREGGHGKRRVIHAADATGKAVETVLIERAHEQANISVLTHHIGVNLVRERLQGGQRGRCIGAHTLDLREDRIKAISARATVIASGGCSKVYLYTSNPDGSTGDGIAMAWRIGCRVGNMEFAQFHPTCLFHPAAKSFLITEAVRGEGGHLLLPDGNRFMDRFDARAELAPRDVVARAIDHEMKRLGAECLYLDISHKPDNFIKEHFPTVYQRCLEYGFDMTRDPLPVVPAAHYTCGGILTDLRARTDVPGLWAIGEAAYTGLHGANRMASNSLLECLVFAESASQDIPTMLEHFDTTPALRDWDETGGSEPDEEVVVTHNWEELRHFMWDYVGIVRTDKRLARSRSRVQLLQREINEYYWNFRITSDLLELRNLTQVAELIIRSAQRRKESRGLHYTLDYPEADNSRPPLPTILAPEAFGGMVWPND